MPEVTRPALGFGPSSNLTAPKPANISNLRHPALTPPFCPEVSLRQLLLKPFLQAHFTKKGSSSRVLACKPRLKSTHCLTTHPLSMSTLTRHPAVYTASQLKPGRLFLQLPTPQTEADAKPSDSVLQGKFLVGNFRSKGKPTFKSFDI